MKLPFNKQRQVKPAKHFTAFLSLLSIAFIVLVSHTSHPSDLEQSPTGPLAEQGLGYGPFRDGQDPNVNRFPTLAEIRSDLLQLKAVTRKLRTYSSTGVFASLISQAKHMGFSVLSGAWLGPISKVEQNNQEEIDSLISLANQGYTDTIVVGNESILRRDLSVNELLNYISYVRSKVHPSIRITTAEPWSIWLKYPQLRNAVDLLIVHIYPFWEGKNLQESIPYFSRRFDEIMEVADGKTVIIGETGWPSNGTSLQAGVPKQVVPGKFQQHQYLKSLVKLAAERQISYYWFEAYDEEWKWKEGISSGRELKNRQPTKRDFSGKYPGSSWGILTSNGKIKPHLSDLFQNIPVNPSRLERIIYDHRGLAAFYDIGLDSSNQNYNWLHVDQNYFKLSYPSDETWGIFFITVGKPHLAQRPEKDFSSYKYLKITLRGNQGGESVDIGLKDSQDFDDGSEATIKINNIPKYWKTYKIPLTEFTTANLQKLYIVLEIIFTENKSMTIFCKEVKFIP